VYPDNSVVYYYGAESLGIGQQRAHQPLGIESAFPRSPERPYSRSQPGPPAAKLIGFEPLAGVSLLLLPGYFGLKRRGLGRVEGDPGYPLAPELQIDSGFLLERRGERWVVLPCGKPQLQ
jgi:hypothetical protein